VRGRAQHARGESGQTCDGSWAAPRSVWRWAAFHILERETEMTRKMSVVLYIVVLIAVVVSVDVLFFRNLFWERLIVNIGVVVVFAAFYLRFLKNPGV
jgi:protein-S-isoprenylcysteine O-methyltransferase Ste14